VVKKIKKPKSKEQKQAEKEAKELERQREADGIQDEFQAKGKEVAMQVTENRPLVLGVIGAVIAVGAVLGVMSMMSSQKNTDASVLYDDAIEAYTAPVGEALPGQDDTGPRYADEKERNEKARDLFQRVVDKQAGTGASSLAQLYVGHTSMALGEHDKALAAYDAFLAAANQTDPLYYAGLDGKASVLEAKGDVAGASTTLEKRVSTGSPVAADAALLTLARLYKEQGNAPRARELLERFGTDHAESPLKTDADELLASLPNG
jgi:tetratricopeptide (TPR) repeat protein